MKHAAKPTFKRACVLRYNTASRCWLSPKCEGSCASGRQLPTLQPLQPLHRRSLSAARANGTRDARSVTPEEWSQAYSRIRDGEGLRRVAKAYNISHETLNRRFARNDVSKSRRGPDPFLGHAGEEILVKWLKLNEDLGRCVPMSCFKEKATRIAGDVGHAKFKAGPNFTRRFFKRHPELAPRTAEVTEHARLYAVHPKKLTEYFDMLTPLVKNVPPTRLWNMDESGFDHTTLMRSGRVKVIATRGSKVVQTGGDGNRDRISYCFFFNAAGEYLPPIILLSGKRVTPTKRELMAAYPEALYVLCENSTQTEATWAQCAAFFVEQVVKIHPGGNHLLLMDGHSSRVSLEAINDFRASNNSIFTLPPHSSHVTQPFDVVIAKAIKSHLQTAINSLRLGHNGADGMAVSHKNVMLAFKIAFSKTMLPRLDDAMGDTYTLAAKGFAKAGIYPLKREIVEARYQKPAEWFDEEIESKKEPPPAVPMDERAAIVKKHTEALMEAGDVAVQLEKHVKAKREHAVPGCTLLTGDAHIAKSLAAEQVKAAADATALEKKKAREETAAANKELKVARAARVAAKKAAKAAVAGDGAGGDADAASDGGAAPANPAAGKGGKRRRPRVPYMEVDAREVERKLAGERRAARMAARDEDDE
jgi:hypothetical protein